MEARRSACDGRQRNLKDAFDGALPAIQYECANRCLLSLHDRTALEADAFLNDLPLELMASVTSLESDAADSPPCTFRHELSLFRHFGQSPIPDLRKTLTAKEAAKRDQFLITSLLKNLALIRADNASQTLTELVKNLAVIKERKASHLLPRVQDFSEESTGLVLQSEAALQAVRIWWQQPAQYIELGLEIDGTTLGSYVGRISATD